MNNFVKRSGYFIRRKELDDVIEKLTKLEAKVKDKFCEITYDTLHLKECDPDSPPDPSKRPQKGKFCERLKSSKN